MINNTITNGDCIELMRSMEDCSIDLTVTDPPYIINYLTPRSTSKFSGVEIANDNNEDWLDDFFIQLFRVTKNVAYIFCGWSSLGTFQEAAVKAGFTLKNVLVWDKMHIGMGNNYRHRYELIMLLCKTNFKTKRHDIPNILAYKKVHHSKATHVSEKPVELLELLIDQSSDEGDVVFDPFCGSGSTLDAAKHLKRDYIGFDINSDYAILADKRIKEKYATN